MSMIRLATLVLLGAPGLAVFNEKECDAEFGNCLDISQCPESSRKHNLCPSQGRDVKCCIPYDVTDCLNIGGHCKRNDSACDGYWISSRCQQPANVQCCVARTSSSQTSKSPSLQPTAASSNNGCGRKKEMEALDFILRNGKCQNSLQDPGNKYDGHWGYSCMRITPEQAYKNIDKFRGCTNGFEGPKAMFAKWCFDRNETAFTEAVDEIFRTAYYDLCMHLEQPAFTVCADINVLSGRCCSNRFLEELGLPGPDLKDYARHLNERYRKFFTLLAEANSTKYGGIVLQRRLAMSNDREVYIAKYACLTSQHKQQMKWNRDACTPDGGWTTAKCGGEKDLPASPASSDDVMFGLSWREILLNLAAIILITCVASFLVWRKKLYLHMRNYCRAAQLRPRKSNRGIDDPAGANGLHSLYNHDANAVKAVNLNASDGQTAIVSNTDATNLNAFDRQTAIVATADASIPITTMNPMIVPTNVNTPSNIDSAVNILANISAIRPPETVASAYAYDLTELQQNTDKLNAFIEKIKRENVAEISLNQIYAFGEMLGSGVDGIVFATYITPAKLGSEPQKFALKIANADDLQAQLMLAKEAYTTVRQRQHPNLLSVAGIGKFGGCSPKFFILIPFAENGSLKNYLDTLRASSMPQAKIYESLLCIAIGLTEGVRALHSANHVHMDLRAANVLITKNTIAKIADFGRACRCTNGEYNFHSQKKLRPMYWYPIEAFCENRYLFESDIWSLGVTFWEIFSLGLNPYDELPSDLGMLKQHLLTNGRLPIHKAYLASDNLKQLMQQCWQRTPSDRPKTTTIVEELKQEYLAVCGRPFEQQMEAEILQMAES